MIKSRNSTTTIITQSRGDISSIPEHENHAPVELSMTWFLQQIDTNDLTSHFNVNTESDATKTPRRNEATEQAIDFSQRLRKWCRFIRMHFIYLAERILRKHHAPAVPMQHPSTKIILDKVQGKYSIFVPILPLMEDGNREGGIDINQVENKSILSFRSTENDEAGSSTMLPMTDMSKLLNEHVRTLEEALDGVVKSCSPDQNDIISSSEVIFTLLCDHVFDLASMFSDCMAYIESMMENQLIAAIGKRLTSEDLDNFVRFHNSKLLLPAPKPFSHSICRPEHYPVGLISIESQNGENTCIYSHTREVYPSSSLKIPLTAATVLELTGEQHLHGWMQHKFGSSHKSHQLIARARQFSSFILVIGSMNGPAALEPKDAIIVQNKDEVLIPLLLDELPTAKEFKDAVKSLSTEQQRFANSYRSMQLESSIFGICVIQVKPQLESLLRLPPDALDKEMKLTNDLMDLFVEYQVIFLINDLRFQFLKDSFLTPYCCSWNTRFHQTFYHIMVLKKTWLPKTKSPM